MAARLISPYPLVWSWRRPVSDAEGPCPIRSWPVDGAGRGWGPRSTAGAGFGILAARGVRGVRLQLNPTRITRLPSLLPRLDALDGRQGPGRRPGAECPAARRWRRQHLARQVGNGEIGPPPPRRPDNGWSLNGCGSNCDFLSHTPLGGRFNGSWATCWGPPARALLQIAGNRRRGP